VFKVVYCPLILLLMITTAVTRAGLLSDHSKTDNQSDFVNPDTQDIRADANCPLIPGQWTYHQWDEQRNLITPLRRGNPEIPRFAGKWVIDNHKKEATWWVGPQGQMRSDNRPLITAYTIAPNEAGKLHISGNLAVKNIKDCRLRIYQTGDTQLHQIDAQTFTSLFDSRQTGSHDFDLTVAVEPGNDICLVFQGEKNWWVTRTLIVHLETLSPSH